MSENPGIDIVRHQRRFTKEILPRVSAIARPSQDRSLERRSNSMRRQDMPAVPRPQLSATYTQGQLLKNTLIVNLSESPKQPAMNRQTYARMDDRNSSFSKSTVKNLNALPSKEYMEKLDQVIEELSALEIQNKRVVAENSALREELERTRSTRSTRLNSENEEYARRFRELEDSARELRQTLEDKEQELGELERHMASQHDLQNTNQVYMGFVADLSRLFTSDAISLEQLRVKIENLLRESQSIDIRVHELEAALREKQHIGNEQLQGVISKYNEAVFQKNELELKLFDLKEEKLTLKNSNDELSKKLSSQADQISILTKDQMVAKMEAQDVMAELQIYRAQFDNVKAKCDSLAAEKEALQRDLVSQEKELIEKIKNTQDSKLQVVQELEVRHSSFMQNLQAERDRLRMELEETRMEMTKIVREREHMASNMTRLQTTLDEMYSNQQTLIRSKQQLQTSLRESAGQLTQFHTQHRIRYQMSVTQAQQQLSDVSRQNNDLQLQLTQISNKNQQLVRQVEELRKDNSNKLVALDKLRFENGQLGLTVEEVKRDIRSKQCEVEAIEKSLNYQIESVDRARRLMQEEYQRERSQRIQAEGRLRQAEFSLLENANKVFMLEKQAFEINRLNELLRNQSESKMKLQNMIETQRGELSGAKQSLKTKQYEWQRQRNTLLSQIKSLQSDLQNITMRTSQLHTQSNSRVQQMQERINQLVFELQSAKNQSLNVSNNYDSELHKMRLEKERNMAEQNTLKINVDRLQQQVKDAEEEIDRSRKELQAVCDRYERECDQFRSDSQYKTQHYENLIREIKQTSAQEEAVRIKAELAEKLSQQYEQRLAAVRTQMSQQETQRTQLLRQQSQNRMKQYLQQISELHSQVEAYQKQIYQISQQSSSTKNEQSWQIMHLQQRFKDVNEGLSQTEKFYQARIDQLTQQLSNKVKEHEMKIQEIKNQEAIKQERLIERIKASEVKGYNGELSRLADQYEALTKRQHKQYEQSANLIKVGLEHKINEISIDLQGKITLYQERVKQLQKVKSDLERQLSRSQTQSQNKCLQYQLTIKDLNAQMRDKEDALRRKLHEDRDFEDNTAMIVTELQGKLHRIQIRSQQLESQLISQRKTSQLMKSGQSEVQKKTMQMIQSLKKEMSQANIAANELRMRNHTLEVELERLRRQLETNREKQGYSEVTVESRRQDISKVEEKNRIIVEQREEIQNLLHRYDKLRLEMSAREDKHYQQVRSLKDIAFNLEKENIEVNSRMQLMEIKAEELRIENRQLKEEIKVSSQLKHSTVSRVVEMPKPITAKTDYTLRPPQTQPNKRGDKEALNNIHMIGGTRTISPPPSNLRILTNNLSPKPQTAQTTHMGSPQIIIPKQQDEYRLPRKSIVENMVRIGDDNVLRKMQPTTFRNQSSKSPVTNERKITVTYDTTKRAATNQNIYNNTVVKSSNNPVEIVTKITTHSPRIVKEERNKSNSRERPKLIQIGGNTRPSVQFSSPPPRLDLPATAKTLVPTQLTFVSPLKGMNESKEVVRKQEGQETSFFERETYFENRVENFNPNIMRVNSSHSIGTLQTVPRVSAANMGNYTNHANGNVVNTTVIDEYQSKPLTVVKSDKKITEIKRLHSNSNAIKIESQKVEQSQGEEQGIRVFQMSELNRKSCC